MNASEIYKLYIENPDGNAVQTGAVLTVSDVPAWQTAAGSLGSFSAGATISTITKNNYDLPMSSKVKIHIHDMNGKRVCFVSYIIMNGWVFKIL